MSHDSVGGGLGSRERWLPVVGFEGFFEVSDLGRVRSLPRLVKNGARMMAIKGRVLRPSHLADGYPRMVLNVEGKQHAKLVHRLVAEAFHADTRNALHREVDHIDHDRSNARADNLRWVSHAHNLARRPGKRTHSGKITGEQLREIAALKGKAKPADVAGKFGVTIWTVYAVWRGRPWVLKRLENTAPHRAPCCTGSRPFGDHQG
jgi:hypothetical protein